MNARTADNAGILKLKMLVMESIKKFLREYTDQVISLRAATAGTGVHLVRAKSLNPQASSTKLLEPQAASIKPQAQRFKLQAASSKLLDLGSWKKFYGARIKGLYQDK